MVEAVGHTGREYHRTGTIRPASPALISACLALHRYFKQRSALSSGGRQTGKRMDSNECCLPGVHYAMRPRTKRENSGRTIRMMLQLDRSSHYIFLGTANLELKGGANSAVSNR